MINLGEVHCRRCGDAFEPDGYVGEEGALCSSECEEGELNQLAYDEARYGSAPVF